MKTLFLLRHGSAADRHLGLNDFERPLTKDGRREIDDIAQQLRHKGIAIESFLSSSAFRAVESAQRLAKKMGFPLSEISYEKKLFSSSFETYRAFIKTLDEKCTTALFVGHNPELEALIKHFVPNAKEAFGKGYLAAITFKKGWAEADKGDGTLHFLLKPAENLKAAVSDLRRALEPRLLPRLREAIQAELGADIARSLDDALPKAISSLVKRVAKAAAPHRGTIASKASQAAEKEAEPEVHKTKREKAGKIEKPKKEKRGKAERAKKKSH